MSIPPLPKNFKRESFPSPDHLVFTVKNFQRCNPGMVLGQNIPDNDRPDYRPVALIGRVPVKATLENGRIRRGDHLAPSSKSGYAMKARPGDSIIGMALEDFKEAEGTVLCFIKAGVNFTSEIESLRRDNERLSREISELRSLIEGR